jgi:hypothetical protein
MFPAFVLVQAQVDLHEGTPLGPLGLADKVHAGLLRGVIGLAGIARNTRANDVFPSRWAAAIAGNDVIQVQVFAVEGLAAILTGVVIALENIVPCEFHFLFGKAVEHDEQDNARHADLEGNGADALGVRLLIGKVLPLIEAESLKGAVLRIENDLSVAFEEQGERAPGGADINSLPQPVQHQHVLIEKRAHADTLAQNVTQICKSCQSAERRGGL